ncbi:uncharacterized protein LOC113566447 [Drosophila persimilis]|uniref:uncharacterized protein LOC113566447 n=1 Tax=Drosophila persimilis TaxID=7234 RepID=UPI000F091422|nr:uncharacterized protein LOC113566447 [Drosophila persimilis]
MSCFKDGKYYALISSPSGDTKILMGLTEPEVMFYNIRTSAKNFGIKGGYLLSAEYNAILANEIAIRHALMENHTIIVAESANQCTIREKSMDSDLELTTDERKAFKLFLKAFVKGEVISKAPQAAQLVSETELE